MRAFITIPSRAGGLSPRGAAAGCDSSGGRVKFRPHRAQSRRGPASGPAVWRRADAGAAEARLPWWTIGGVEALGAGVIRFRADLPSRAGHGARHTGAARLVADLLPIA